MGTHGDMTLAGARIKTPNKQTFEQQDFEAIFYAELKAIENMQTDSLYKLFIDNKFQPLKPMWVQAVHCAALSIQYILIEDFHPKPGL